MDCTYPVRIMRGVDPAVYPEGVSAPCGKCAACRIASRREWTIRVMHELTTMGSGMFVTLTYDDEHLPFNKDWQGVPSIDPTLQKTDLQKYFKRLRKDLGTHKIKHFSCGEYGDLNQRPHYHSIIMGLDILNDNHHEVVKANWNKGIVDIGNAEFDSVQYVVGYIDKKLSGPQAQKEYNDRGRNPVFRLVSNGIGLQFCKDNAKQFTDNLYVQSRNSRVNLPRYYVNKLSIDKEVLKQRSEERDRADVFEKSGINMTRGQLLFSDHKTEKTKIFSDDIRRNKQKRKNLTAKFNLKSRDIH